MDHQIGPQALLDAASVVQSHHVGAVRRGRLQHLQGGQACGLQVLQLHDGRVAVDSVQQHGPPGGVRAHHQLDAGLVQQADGVDVRVGHPLVDPLVDRALPQELGGAGKGDLGLGDAGGVLERGVLGGLAQLLGHQQPSQRVVKHLVPVLCHLVAQVQILQVSQPCWRLQLHRLQDLFPAHGVDVEGQLMQCGLLDQGLGQLSLQDRPGVPDQPVLLQHLQPDDVPAGLGAEVLAQGLDVGDHGQVMQDGGSIAVGQHRGLAQRLYVGSHLQRADLLQFGGVGIPFRGGCSRCHQSR